MRRKIQIYNSSIETAGVCKDYKVAISEYIWNSFDAEATTVEINTKANELGSLDYMEIVDNGKGICFETIDETFGAFLVSQKGVNPKWSNIHGSEGKGRFSFIAFAHKAIWETIYEINNLKTKYNIEITSDDKDFIDIKDKEETSCEKTGTKVTFTGISGISKEHISSYDFKKCLSNIFAWFLFLNKDKDYKIIIDGEILDYSDIIDDKISETKDVQLDGYTFKINFIKWIGKINEKYYYYFIDKKHYEKYKQFTTFNNNSIEFPHSVYIISDYFDDFAPVPNSINSNQTILYGKSQKDDVFIKLIKELKNLVENKRKKVVKEDAPKVIGKLNKEGVFPKFKNSKYDQERKKDLEEVVTEIYSIQPKIFQRCSTEQKKSIIGFLNLLLDTDERENIVTIMDDITKLTPEERNDLNNVLKKTNLSRIIKTIKMLESRFNIIEILKKLVYDLSEFTNERNHIQRTIEENYWLFGEQYNLVTADKNFEKVLKEYLYVIDDNKNKEDYKIENQDRLRRPDIFMCRSRSLEFHDATQGEENIIIELKEPKVVLNKKVYRQIEDYMDLIMHENRFNSGLRKWKFIMVSTSVDDFVRTLYKSLEDKGRPFLFRWHERFEIYAMTWDDVFKSFDIRHQYLLNKLEFDRDIILEELEANGIDVSREGSNELTQRLLEFQAN